MSKYLLREPSGDFYKVILADSIEKAREEDEAIWALMNGYTIEEVFETDMFQDQEDWFWRHNYNHKL